MKRLPRPISMVVHRSQGIVISNHGPAAAQTALNYDSAENSLRSPNTHHTNLSERRVPFHVYETGTTTAEHVSVFVLHSLDSRPTTITQGDCPLWRALSDIHIFRRI